MYNITTHNVWCNVLLNYVLPSLELIVYPWVHDYMYVQLHKYMRMYEQNEKRWIDVVVCGLYENVDSRIHS